MGSSMGDARDRVNAAMREAPAQAFLFLFSFSLAFMRPPIELLGFISVPSDFVFLGMVSVWALLLALQRSRLVWDPAYCFIGAYLLAMVASAAAADVPSSSAAKLLTQVYLLSLPIIVCSLVRDEEMLRRAILWWLAGAAVVSFAGLASLLAFAVDRDNPILDYTRFGFGTLPPGNYPRLSLTFLNANMACNYLTVSLMLLLAARRQGWIGKLHFLLLLGGILTAALSTISPGLGGIALAVGLWMWMLKGRRGSTARLFLVGGTVTAALFVGAMAVTPILHPTAPFLIHVPALDVVLAPAGRLMIWMDAGANVFENPLLGRGIGSDAVLVRYQNPSGHLEQLTDAHNNFLNIAVQCGLVGLAALVALIGHMVRRTVPLRLPDNDAGVFRVAVGIGLLNGLVYQGLGGSFEDARHLWFAFGLLLASGRIESCARRMPVCS